MNPIDDLRVRISGGRAILVVGAGVSLGASGGHPAAGWIGLLESGIAWCESGVPGIPDGWPSLARGLIAQGDIPGLLSVAQMLTDYLGGRDGGEYRRWLHETVGSLPLVKSAVPKALLSLGVPVATTNYDGLLEASGPGWGTITWREGAKLQRAVQGAEHNVIHLHGHWDEPASVVLGVSSYEAVLGNAAAQALQQALAAMHSLVFVGVGSGAEDPNLGSLRDWLKKTFPDSEYRHFRLCRDDEVNALATEHKGERIVPVAYGASHDDLAPFLSGLGTRPRTRVDPPPGGVAAVPARRRTLGRDATIAGVVANLVAEAPAPTVVLGPLGIGKTNLTLAALHDPGVVARFGSRCYFVRCEGSPSPASVLADLAAALGVGLTGPDPLPAVLARLGESPALVVLDNAETPWEANTLGTEELFGSLAEIPGLGLLVSLRGNERPAGAAWATPVRLSPLSDDDTRSLFLSIAGERFDAPGLDELLAEMGGIPLAIELLAYASEGEPDLATLAKRWRQERAEVLRRGAADHRELSIAVSVEASWGGPHMTDPARRLLSVLCRLPDGLAHDSLEPLMPGEARAAASVLRLRGLAFDEVARLRTYPPVRHYVERAHLPDGDDWHRARQHYEDLALELGPKVGTSGGAEAVSRLLADIANIRTSLLDLLAVGSR